MEQNNSEKALKMLELRNIYQDSLLIKRNRLAIVREALNLEFEQEKQELNKKSEKDRLEYYVSLNKTEFTRKDYMGIFKDISSNS